jgi:hypothetical protein
MGVKAADRDVPADPSARLPRDGSGLAKTVSPLTRRGVARLALVKPAITPRLVLLGASNLWVLVHKNVIEKSHLTLNSEDKHELQ